MVEIPTTGQFPAEVLSGGQFFTYALPWLLTFAIVYGFLEHYEVPKSVQARAVISVVLAFFVMPMAAPVMAFLQQIGASLIIAVTGIIFFLVLLELTQTKKREEKEYIHPQTGEQRKGVSPSKSVIEGHPKTFGAIVLVILGVIFWGAGGFQAAGLEGIIPRISWPTLFFLGILALAIWWMVSESG